MALTLTKVREFEPAPGQPKRHMWLVRFDDNYPVGGWSIAPADLTGTPIKNFADAWIENRDSYMILGAYADTAANTIRITVAASHNSAGVGGHALNTASNVMLNKLAYLFIEGT